MAILGQKTRANIGTYEETGDYKSGILFSFPHSDMQKAPLMALIASLESESCTNPEYHWHLEDGIPYDYLTVASQVAADGTSITVSETNGALATRKGITLRVIDTGELILCTADGSGQTITTTAAYRGFGTTAAAIIPAGAKLEIIGSASPEGDTSPTPRSGVPTLYTQYNQIIRESFSVTTQVNDTDTRTGNQLANEQFRALVRWAMSAEKSFFWSELAKVTDATTGTYNYGMKGLNSWITTNRFEGLGLISRKTVMDCIDSVFDRSSNSSPEKLWLCGSLQYTSVYNAITNDSRYIINIEPKEDEYGLGFKKIVGPRGTIFIMSHPLFNSNSVHAGDGFILDVPNLKYRYLQNEDLQLNEDIKKDDNYHGRKDEFWANCSIQVVDERSMAFVGGVTGWNEQ